VAGPPVGMRPAGGPGSPGGAVTVRLLVPVRDAVFRDFAHDGRVHGGLLLPSYAQLWCWTVTTRFSEQR
jgi:hypothetical protein